MSIWLLDEYATAGTTNERTFYQQSIKKNESKECNVMNNKPPIIEPPTRDEIVV